MSKSSSDEVDQVQGLGPGLRPEQRVKQGVGVDSLDASETSEEIVQSHDRGDDHQDHHDYDHSDCGDDSEERQHEDEEGTRNRTRTNSQEDGLMDALMTHHPLADDSQDSQDDTDDHHHPLPVEHHDEHINDHSGMEGSHNIIPNQSSNPS